VTLVFKDVLGLMKNFFVFTKITLNFSSGHKV